MDPETQKLIEKTRQRREMLNQRMAALPEAAPRKRRTPVLENEADTVLAEMQMNQDDSPKRACVRDMEMDIKPDTPAIRSVLSRAKDLPSMLTGGNQENTMETPTPKPRKSVSSPPLERRAPACVSGSPARDDMKIGASSTRKNRFAALASSINNWEDDLSHHVVQKEEVKKPKWQPPAKTESTVSQIKPVPSGKGPAPAVPKSLSSSAAAARSEELPMSVGSPKRSQAPATPCSPANNLTRNSPLRTSKVELNRSPKPFSSNYVTSTASPSKSATELARVTSSKRPVSPVKAVSDSTISSYNSLKSGPVHDDVTATAPPTTAVTSQNKSNALISDSRLNNAVEEPTQKPVSERFSTWAKKVGTPVPAEPSRQPLSAKLATFEKKIQQNTPKTGHFQSVHVPKTTKQICTPVFSASTPAATSSSSSCASNNVPKVSDPSELPISQRMSRMQEKLSNTPQRGQGQDEPTTYPVGARMSAWETMTASNLVSNIKKVNPGEVALTPRPVSEIVTRSAPLTPGPPQNPPPPPSVSKSLSSKKSFKESIEERASQILAKKDVQSSSSLDCASVSSPKKIVPTSPSKIKHSPSKVSAGTKNVQKLLIGCVQESNTTASAMAAQIRAARLAELNVIQNRWQNGVLRDDGTCSSSETVLKPSDEASDPPQGATPQKHVGGEAKTPATSGKREESRNRARADFNNKLALIGLSGNEAAAPPQATTSAAACTPVGSIPGGNKTSSIYNLIKKREEDVTQNTDNSSRKVKFDDSFDDSDDDSSRKIPNCVTKRLVQQSSSLETEEFKKPQVPRMREESESDIPSSSDQGEEEFGPSSRMMIDIDDDDISLKGFVSEATRRESILPAPVPQSSSQSSLDSSDDHMTVDSEESRQGGCSIKHGGYRPDDDSTDESDDRHAVDDLLDEALDDSSDEYDPDMDPNNVVMRRKPEQAGYDPDMDIDNVVMRRKVATAPVPAQRGKMGGADSSDDNSDNRPYSLEAYRKSATINQHMMMDPIVRKSKYADAHIEEEDIVMPSIQQQQPHHQRDDKRVVLDRIRELQELVQYEQSVIMQTSNALNKCCMGNSYFAGSSEQVECNRLLLIACQKRQGYMTEIQRLKEMGHLSDDGPGPHGSLTISDIRLPLKKDFVTKIGTSQDTTTHFFILIIRNGPQLICTEMLSTHDPMMRGSLDFPNLIKINGITGNFKLTMDIYGMSVSREVNTKKSKKLSKKNKGYALTLESPGGPSAVRTTSFSQVTSIQLTMKCLDKSSFHLDRLPYLSPLYGQIFMRLKCCMEANVEERSFLTMFDDVSGFGAWHRRWCVLTGNKICVWKYPDDETRKDPMAVLDLKRCITEKVGLVPRDICARPNTFELTTVRQPLKGEHDTLVTRTHNSTTTVRHQMSADSKEERIVWCNKINRALANLRTWSADAIKPSKQASTPSSSSSSYHR